MAVRHSLIRLSFPILFWTGAWAQQFAISTVAGTGTSGFAGDSGPAKSAELNDPTGIALDSSGNLYIADAENNVIRKVSGGSISTIAGNNTFGYSGDGGTAITGQLNGPVAVTVDSSGNVFIADSFNNAIREVTTDGYIHTIVGGAATTLQLNHPVGLAIDAKGALYIADTDSRRILKFVISKRASTLIAGNGTFGISGDGGPAVAAGLGDPMGLAVDSAGNVYIADTLNSRVRKVTPDGIINTIAGDGIDAYFGDGGPATKAGIYFPHDVTVDTAGNIYIADTSNNVIRLLQPEAPAVFNKGVVNAANFKAQISPGALASVFGTSFASQNLGSGFPLTAMLGGVSVNVNGKAAPVLYVTLGQVNFQVPWETAVGTASVTVTVNGKTSAAVSVPVLTAAPGLFVSSSGRAVVQNADSSPNSAGHPAKVGSTVTAYLTGSGPVSPAVADGAASPKNPAIVTSSRSATIGSESAEVSFAGLAPGFVGLLQMNIVVPSGLATGDYPLTVTIAGETSNAGTISVTQ